MKTRWHLFALTCVAGLVGLHYLQEPGFGDDFTYWSFGVDLHERGFRAWQMASFHDLRWPVWGVCWLLQSLFGNGLASYYGEPLLYLAAGASVAFLLGQKLSPSRPLGWICGLAFLFHPLLDTVCYRPMPDLSEGVWGGGVLLAWWALMEAPTRPRSLLLAALTGLLIYVLESNRLTGVFIVPVLLLGTALYFPRRFGWLILVGTVAAVFYAAEGGFYHWRFGDFLHNLHANLGGKGNKGTEAIALWYLPLRFVDTLFKGNPLAPIYTLLALLGGITAWRRHGLPGRLIVLWFTVLFLEYSCAPQSLWPYRPLIRDADRFLCGLTIPLSILAALGGLTLFRLPLLARLRPIAWLTARPRAAVALTAGLLLAISSRERFDLGFVPEMRRYVAGLPDGTRIFTHQPMRLMTQLIDDRSARRFTWFAPEWILNREEKLEAEAAQADEFWYARKLVWLSTRKKLEKKTLNAQPPLASYFASPERDWVLTRLLAKGDTPDLIFYHRRQANSPPPLILERDAPVWQQLIPKLPAYWERTADNTDLQTDWKVPVELRGTLARFEIGAAAEQVQALAIRLHFTSNNGRKTEAEYLLKPYLYADGGKEFFAFTIPAASDTCHVQLKFAKNAQKVTFTSFRALIEKNSVQY